LPINGFVTWFAFSANNKILWTVHCPAPDHDSVVSQWSLEGPAPAAIRAPLELGQSARIAHSPDLSKIGVPYSSFGASSYSTKISDSHVRVFDVAADEPIPSIRLPNGILAAPVFSPSGTLLIVGAAFHRDTVDGMPKSDVQIVLLDWRNQRVVKYLGGGHQGRIVELACVGDSSLLSVSLDGIANVWDMSKVEGFKKARPVESPPKESSVKSGDTKP
jgi:hypothetical protein